MKVLRTVLILLPVLALSYCVVRLDERLSCIADNVSEGHFWSTDLSSDVVVTGNERSKRIDLTKLRQFKNVCVVQMYTHGAPYGFNLTSGKFNHAGRRACWREEPGKLTIAGIDGAGNPTWTHLKLEGLHEWYKMAGEQCVEPNAAILNCVGDVCSFSARQ